MRLTLVTLRGIGATMEAELLGLAGTAATTIVALLTTDAWGTAKAAIRRLWQRVHPERLDTVLAELDETREELVAACAAGDDATRAAMVVEWQRRLVRLLAADPAAAPLLRDLLAEELAPALSRGGPVAVRVQETGSVIQTGGGVANTGVVIGDVTVGGTNG
jgi:hypothetical protein